MRSDSYPVVTAEGVFLCSGEDIICVEATKRKATVYTAARTMFTADTVETWRKKLTLPCFYMTHRSYIINMRYVRRICKDKVYLQCADRLLEVYLTRRKYTHFRDTYLLYMDSVR